MSERVFSAAGAGLGGADARDERRTRRRRRLFGAGPFEKTTDRPRQATAEARPLRAGPMELRIRTRIGEDRRGAQRPSGRRQSRPRPGWGLRCSQAGTAANTARFSPPASTLGTSSRPPAPTPPARCRQHGKGGPAAGGRESPSVHRELGDPGATCRPEAGPENGQLGLLRT